MDDVGVCWGDCEDDAGVDSFRTLIDVGTDWLLGLGSVGGSCGAGLGGDGMRGLSGAGGTVVTGAWAGGVRISGDRDGVVGRTGVGGASTLFC